MFIFFSRCVPRMSSVASELPNTLALHAPPPHSPTLAQLTRVSLVPALCSCRTQEVPEGLADVLTAFQIREVTAVADRHQLCLWNGPSDVVGDFHGNEIGVAGDDKRRNAQASQLRFQVVAFELPRVAHQSI